MERFRPYLIMDCNYYLLPIFWLHLSSFVQLLLSLLEVPGVPLEPLAMAAGAIVSGAFFGDKMSPLSDKTNLAPAIANVSIFDHIRHMLWTTIPSLLITLSIFVVLGLQLDKKTESFLQMTSLLTALKNHFPIPTLVLGLIAAVITTYVTVPDITLGKIMTTAISVIRLKRVSPMWTSCYPAAGCRA